MERKGDAYCLKACARLEVKWTASVGRLKKNGIGLREFGQFVDINSGRESTLFGQNTIHV